jgi:hypothetical protein
MAQSSRADSYKKFAYALAYIFGLGIWLLLWPILGGIFSSLVALTIFSGIILFFVAWNYMQQRTWSRLLGELLTPASIWLLFGVGGIIAILRVNDMYIYSDYQDYAVLLMAVFAFLGALAYVIGFKLTYRNFNRNGVSVEYVRIGDIYLIVLLLLALDWFVRFMLIRRGLYFTWVMRTGFDNAVRGTNFLFHVQRTIGPTILPLLLYCIYKSRKKGLWKFLLVAHLILISLGGDRRDVLFSGVILVLSYGIIYRIHLSRKMIVIGLICGVIFFAIIGPMIQEARFLMRQDGPSLLESPASIPQKFIFEYLPSVANFDTIFSPEVSSRQGLLGRIGSYASYAASINQEILDGQKLLGARELWNAISLVIPRALYPQKPVVDADYIVQSHFTIGRPGFDANGTYVADIFAHLHVLGIIGLFTVGGLAYGFVMKHLVSSYAMIGELILIGLLPVLVPTGDSFAQYLADLRNVLLLLLAFRFVFRFSHYIDQVNRQFLVVKEKA